MIANTPQDCCIRPKRKAKHLEAASLMTVSCSLCLARGQPVCVLCFTPSESDAMLALRSPVLLPQALRARRQAAWTAGLRTPAFWVSRSKTLVGPERLNADVHCSFCTEAVDTLKEVQMQNKQLRVQLSKSPWPILSCFSSQGQTYSLPLRAESRDLKRLATEPVLAYLAGFFDGDGCVTRASGLSGCYLSTSQSFDQAEVLMLFYETFGGSIIRQGQWHGPAQTCSCVGSIWTVRPKCRSAPGSA